ncbi:ABC transporter substrate-binding protein [Salarchaeum sp. JOR-1]|uniref:ABC transporter substrate-binding protein n=1 Tax=Salarchaeum sp. JOR-1 TaxID=2599399 RepID=UPI001198655B|nr:ABC transporter substrate-binding protein [Salarchaeum sp. JOR-1]QDX41762.1 peptide ABC transporter substrate-binding protein [Salarchaeum sp. JOR-1]
MAGTDEQNSTSRRTFLTGVGGAAVTTALAGCQGGGDTTTDTTTQGTTQGTTNELQDFPVTITQGQMPTTLDPQDHRSTPTDNVVLHTYEGLLSRSRTGQMQAQLATDWERMEDGRVRFQIRDGPTFHSGNDLTPGDVAYSINRIVKPDVGINSPQSDQLAGVTGAEVVDGERAVDVMSSGLNPIVFSLFATYGDVMEQAWVEENSTDYIATHMNGTGPFEFSDYEQGVNVVLERYNDYWQEPAAVSELTFNAAKESSTRVNQLIAGETDVVVNVPPQDIARVQNGENTRIDAVSSSRVIYNAMRYDVEPFDSPQFRQAMNYAVDMQAIIQSVLDTFGDATSQPTLEGFVGFNEELTPYPHDPAQAEQLVEDSGYAGAEIELHTPVGRYLKDVEIAQAVVNQIDELPNVSATLNQREFASLAGELTDGDITTSPHWYLIGWGNATFDASQTLVPLLTSNGALTSYKNDEFDSLVEQAQSESDPAQRKQYLEDANAHANEQAPWIFLNRQYSVYGVSQRVSWRARRDERIDAYAMSQT